ncbi:hypothetical protein H0H81_010993 [Sphagnurus paluster]|uniref:RNA-dependent RNA polymerase n=1 Tax=Sphagnurus paluster TaxID=117069 RepID=A0A9P7GPC9_9AGAR|nr:hypothetical protein H0H81_010993 [Sphagnurus paluster]
MERIPKRKLSEETANTPSQDDNIPTKRQKHENVDEPYIIAYSPRIQNYPNIPYGVLWELARFVSRGELAYDGVAPEYLNELREDNVRSAPKTEQVFFPQKTPQNNQDPAFAQENAATSPWEELDKEEEALAQDQYAGLGHTCSLVEFFLRPFILWGHVFRSFYAKDETVFMFRTNEMLINGEIISDQRLGMSLLKFIDWHNPPMFNTNQAMSKWAARTALGLSNSIPGPIIEPENILHIDDIVSPEGSDMTDGCGSATRSTTMQIYRLLRPETWPTAFQFRVAGSKGMLLEASETSTTESPKLWLRPSQIKIKYPAGHHDHDDPSLRIIDLLRTSYMRSPGRVSAETIINLAENGVPHSVFVQLMQSNLAELVEGLTTWEGPDAMYNLWTNVERAGAVIFSRKARAAAGESRARGFGERTADEDDEEDSEDDDGMKLEIKLEKRSAAWWTDQTSGCPSSLEETVMVLLDAGFTPQSSPILREKLKQVVATRIKNKTTTYRYDLPCSALAFVVPDPYGVLAPDEIHIKSSRRNLKTEDDPVSDIVLGDVLITRNPCKVPTDVRKVRAVEHPMLRSYTDVIVCSVKGHRRLLDFLAGVIWSKEIVEPFKNADEKHSKPPEGLDTCFTSVGNDKVNEFIERTGKLTPLEQTRETQKYLLGALRDPSAIGRYSIMHDTAVYSLGYDHPRTVRLAYKFCNVLDSPKTGLQIRSTTFKDDQKKYGQYRGPAWNPKYNNTAKKKRGSPSYDCPDNQIFTPRGKTQFITGPFVMDVLDSQVKKERDLNLSKLDKTFQPLKELRDPHLTQPWEDALKMATRGTPELVRAKTSDLMKIQDHVKNIYLEHQADLDKNFTNRQIETRQDILRAYSSKFVAYPAVDHLETFTDAASISRLRASCAYVYDLEHRKRMGTGWSRFPWNVALRELCHIKATALGPSKTVTSGFYERFKLSRR